MVVFSPRPSGPPDTRPILGSGTWGAEASPLVGDGRSRRLDGARPQATSSWAQASRQASRQAWAQASRQASRQAWAQASRQAWASPGLGRCPQALSPWRSISVPATSVLSLKPLAGSWSFSPASSPYSCPISVGLGPNEYHSTPASFVAGSEPPGCHQSQTPLRSAGDRHHGSLLSFGWSRHGDESVPSFSCSAIECGAH